MKMNEYIAKIAVSDNSGTPPETYFMPIRAEAAIDALDKADDAIAALVNEEVVSVYELCTELEWLTG